MYHPDIVIRAIIGTGAATDAGDVVDHHLTRRFPGNRPRRAADHAHRIRTVHAGIGDHKAAKRRPVQNKAGVVLVGLRAPADTIAASDAAIVVGDHGGGAVNETFSFAFFYIMTGNGEYGF